MYPNLMVSLPTCRHCGRYWRPAPGVMTTSDYCNRCVESRRATAAAKLDLRPLTVADLADGYLLPRRLRVS